MPPPLKSLLRAVRRLIYDDVTVVVYGLELIAVETKCKSGAAEACTSRDRIVERLSALIDTSSALWRRSAGMRWQGRCGSFGATGNYAPLRRL